MAEMLAHQYGGAGLPNGSAEAKERFYQAAIMRRGFELLWAEVDKQAQLTAREPSWVQQLMDATINQPREVETETEQL
jgi:hypothetical protein